MAKARSEPPMLHPFEKRDAIFLISAGPQARTSVVEAIAKAEEEWFAASEATRTLAQKLIENVLEVCREWSNSCSRNFCIGANPRLCRAVVCYGRRNDAQTLCDFSVDKTITGIISSNRVSLSIASRIAALLAASHCLSVATDLGASGDR
ncbi:MAG: hypothetical protein ACM3SP_14125, partial [Chloroflexota bacterium]